ncbi:MAG: DUF357 domain-containing protein [Methanomicrobiales archaeon]|jgi:hypothetical protein|nr:DUF357 domain-containing protein [Methanomicrobiales archaeon]
MTMHNSASVLQRYEQKLCFAFAEAVFIVKKETPLGICAKQAAEMIHSYLHDATHFAHHDDQVNWLASLGYAHGWFFTTIRLGYMKGNLCEIPDIPVFHTVNQTKLHEKKERYDKMLICALHSIHIAPVSGSPLWKEAYEISEQIKRDLLHSRTQSDENALLTISYAYGVLDCGVRVGLYQIFDHAHLFTTDS